MPFKSRAQMKAAFGGYLGPEMKAKASEFAHKTPNIRALPEHVKRAKKKQVARKIAERRSSKSYV